MTEQDATIRDLQTSLERAQERISQQDDELVITRGLVRIFSISMQTNLSKKPDEARWHKVARWLAYHLATQSQQPQRFELITEQWIAQALQATETTDDARN